jgi:hypothetical protein
MGIAVRFGIGIVGCGIGIGLRIRLESWRRLDDRRLARFRLAHRGAVVLLDRFLGALIHHGNR